MTHQRSQDQSEGTPPNIRPRGYRDLPAWQEAMKLVDEIYDLVEQFPSHEITGLGWQLQRSAVTITANIADGYGRYFPEEFYKHLSVANGALSELQTHLQLAGRRSYITPERLGELLEKTDHMQVSLEGLRAALRARITGDSGSS